MMFLNKISTNYYSNWTQIWQVNLQFYQTAIIYHWHKWEFCSFKTRRNWDFRQDYESYATDNISAGESLYGRNERSSEYFE